MSDWDRTRELRKSSRAVMDKPKRVRYYNVTCSKCGYDYMLNTEPRNIPGAVTPTGGFLCRKCRDPKPKREPVTPPPLQMSFFDKK